MPTQKQDLKVKIAHAYLGLLKKKDSEAISIKTLTEKAGVSRMAFYRKFSSKQAIVEYYLSDILWSEMQPEATEEVNFWSLDYGLRFFQTMKRHKDLIVLLTQRGYSSVILKIFNEINEYVAGDMPQSSIQRYELYYAAGAAFNAMLVWIREGCKESPESMARQLAMYMA